jgi:hypothetical protein
MGHFSHLYYTYQTCAMFILFFCRQDVSTGNWGGSVTIVSDWTTGVRSPAEPKDFFSNLCVKTSSEAHLASYPVGTGGPFPGVKRGCGMTLTTHPV